MFEVPLNKFEKRDLVKKLHKEGKTYREIAHIAHISPRDIKLIIKKYEQNIENNKRRKENNQEPMTKKPSISSQSFMLYQEGKKNNEVKVLLDIPFKVAVRYWKQYLKSIDMFEAFEFYQEYSYDIPTLLSIITFMKRNNVNRNDIVNVLRTANDVNNLNQMTTNLKAEIRSLEHKRMYYSHSSYGLQPLPLNKPYYNYYHYSI